MMNSWATLLVLALLAITSCNRETYQLQFNPANASRYHLGFTNEGTVEVTMLGQSVKTNMDMQVLCRLQFDSTAPGLWDMKFSYVDYDLKQKMSGSSFKFNMDSAAREPLKSDTGFMGLLKSLEFKASIDKMGSITGKTEVDSVWKLVEGQITGMEEKERVQLGMVLKPLLNNDIFSSIMGQCFKIFPDEPVAVGESWHTQVKMLTMFAMVIDNKFTLKSVNNGVAEIEV
ncbi:MAG TPA: DUF6263 family protein, partial [Phnomibacter sp.]|nr:DUF6263 family protein [Phnomibacter sp.]